MKKNEIRNAFVAVVNNKINAVVTDRDQLFEVLDWILSDTCDAVQTCLYSIADADTIDEFAYLYGDVDNTYSVEYDMIEQWMVEAAYRLYKLYGFDVDKLTYFKPEHYGLK